MRRTVRPGLERLEGRALLSGVASATPGLVDSLTAVATRVPSGAQVALTFTETNASDHDITVAHGPTNEGFSVGRGGKAVWNSEGGILPDFLALETLKPHQSLTIGATWDGRSNQGNPAYPWMEGPPLSGTFAASNALDHGAATATVTIPKAWIAPAKPAHGAPHKPAARVHEMTAVDPLP